MSEFTLTNWKKKKYKTKDGREARIICVDRLTNKNPLCGQVIALIKGPSKKYEMVVQYNLKGQQVNYASNYDLSDET